MIASFFLPIIDKECLQLAMDERRLTSHADTQSTTAIAPPTLDSMYLKCYDLGDVDRLSLQQ